MKRSNLKIGSKNTRQARAADGSKVTIDHYVCQYSEPENLADCLKLADGNELEVVKHFNRGYTIKLQDGCGRPMWDAGDKQEAIQAALDNFKLGVTKAIGRPAKPKVVNVEKKATYTQAEVEEMAKRAGLVVNFEK